MEGACESTSFFMQMQDALLKASEDVETPYFKWIKQSVRCKSLPYDFDEIDVANISFGDNAIKKRLQIALLLPYENERKKTIFLTSLSLLNWFICREHDHRDSTILYIGPSSTIRHYLSKVSISIEKREQRRRPRVIKLTDLILRQYLKSSNTIASEDGELWDPYIPKIVLCPTPINPKQLLEQYQPDWLIIDFEDGEKSVPWLQQILDCSQEKSLPLIALLTNPLAHCIPILMKSNVGIFRWPSADRRNALIQGTLYKNNQLCQDACLCQWHNTSSIHSYVVETSYHNNFYNAYKALIKAKEVSDNELAQNAIRLGFRYSRLLESLSVPLRLYEAECRHYWGLKQIYAMKESFKEYIEAIESCYPALADNLIEAKIHLDRVYDLFFWEQDPDLWHALLWLCEQEVQEDSFRIILFPAKARKQLFEFALLSRQNIVAEDLEERRIMLSCFADFKLLSKNLKQNRFFDNSFPYAQLKKSNLNPVVVGLPSYESKPKLEPILRSPKVGFVIHSHLTNLLTNCVEDWNSAMTLDLANNANFLSKTFGYEQPPRVPELQSCLKLLESTVLNFRTKNDNTPNEMQQDGNKSVFNQLYAFDTEFSSIDSDDDEEIECGNIGHFCDGPPILKNENIILDHVIEFIFEEGLKGLFPVDEIVKKIMISNGTHQVSVTTEDTCVDALSVGDKILFIRGQKRQSLYDLLISKIHQHPAIEIQLALINRWHDELINSYERERIANRLSLSKLLEELQIRGSGITTTQTLIMWLNGSTMCPSDGKDLLRLADILHMKFVKRHYKDILRAAQKLRGLHTGFSRRLNNWLLNQATGILGDDECLSEFIDEDLGITLDDFKESLMILTVSMIREKNGMFYCNDIGKLEVLD